jgi:hypothetical protein
MPLNEKNDPEMAYRRGYQDGAFEMLCAVEQFLDPAARKAAHTWIEQDINGWRLEASKLDHFIESYAHAILLMRLISFDARQQLFFQRYPQPHEPLNFRLETIVVVDKLAESLNLRFETIDELDDLAILMTKCVETRVCRH